MYGIFTYIWVILGVNVGKYSSAMEHMGYIHVIILKRSYSSKVIGRQLKL